MTAMGPQIVAFNITSRCNLRCRHCYNDSGSGRQRDLPAEALLGIAEEIRDLQPRQVCLCGGEPLLCPALFEIIACLRPHTEGLSLVSNGWCIDWEMAEKLVACGIDSIQISLDGASPWQHDSLRGIAGAFHRAVRAITYLKKAGLPQVLTSLIPNRMNVRCVEDYFGLCGVLGVDRIRFMPLLALGRGRQEMGELLPGAGEMFAFGRMFSRCRERYADRLQAEWDDPVGSSHYLYKFAVAQKKPVSLCIEADGTVKLDMYMSFPVGNLKKTPLARLWQQEIPAAWQRPEVKECLENLQQMEDFSHLDFSWRVEDT